MNAAEIPLTLIDPPADDDRLERDPAAVRNLADDIRVNGLINAVTLEERTGRYECVAGWTRVLAHRHIGFPTIRADVHAQLSPLQRQRIRLSENLQRSDLTPVEEARRLHSLRESGDMDSEELAQLVHRTPAWVEQRLSLLAIPDDLQALVHTRDLSIAAALTLARCTDADHRSYLTRYATDGGATVATVRAWVEEWKLHTELAREGPAPLPSMPIVNQPHIVLIPCARCHEPHDYRVTAIVRVCQPCAQEIAHAHVADTATARP